MVSYPAFPSGEVVGLEQPPSKADGFYDEVTNANLPSMGAMIVTF